MKKMLLFLPLTAVLLAACGGSSTPTPTVSAPSTVNGTVQSYTGGASTIKLLASDDETATESSSNPALSSAALNANGTFALPLPSSAIVTPYLSAAGSADDGVITNTDTGCNGTITNSDPTAQTYTFAVLHINGSAVYSASVTQNTSTVFGLSVKEWVYVTKATTLRGSFSCSDTSSGANVTHTFSADLALAQGWNVVDGSQTLSVSSDGKSGTDVTSLVLATDGPTTWTMIDDAAVGVQALNVQALKSPLLRAQALAARAEKMDGLLGQVFSGHLKF